MVDRKAAGIWSINMAMFEASLQIVNQDKSLSVRIEAKFCIIWSQVTFDDMNKPIYSGLAAMILIEVLEVKGRKLKRGHCTYGIGQSN